MVGIDYPKDELAERTVLGSLILSPKAFFPIAFSHKLEEEDFYFKEHRELYSVIKELYIEKEEDWDYVVLYDRIRRKGLNISFAFVEELLKEGVSQEYEPLFLSALKIVKEMSIKRQVIDGVLAIFKNYEQKEVKDLLEGFGAIFELIGDQAPKKENRVSAEEIVKTIEQIKSLTKKERLITGITTAFIDLSLLTLGFQDGNFVVIGARPGMGKTSFMLCNALAQAQEGVEVAIFSLEMSANELFQRILAIETGIPLANLRKGFLSLEEIKKMEETGERIARLPLVIVDSPSMSVYELVVEARELKRTRNTKIIYIDYLQLLTANRKYSRQEEVAEISRVLKSLARELNIPVVALAQLSRQVEGRSDKRPQLADLRESGQIEQDADLVIFLHRPEYYKKSPPPEEVGIAEVIIAKHRQGPTGIIKLRFDKETTAFRELGEQKIETEDFSDLKEDDFDEIEF